VPVTGTGGQARTVASRPA